MYLPLTLIPLSTVSWPTSLPVPGSGQAAVDLSIASPTPTSVIGSSEKRQPIYAPVETHAPILEVLAESAPDSLKERASGADDGFDSLLCATLKVLKGENPTLFTGLLQSCNTLTDSGSNRRIKSLKERNIVARAGGGYDGFDSLLCATLKALKGENPALFTGLLQSCNTLTDSGSNRRTKALKERNVVADETDLAADVEDVDNGSDGANMRRGDANLQDERDLDIDI